MFIYLSQSKIIRLLEISLHFENSSKSVMKYDLDNKCNGTVETRYMGCTHWRGCTGASAFIFR
jgi:glutamate racemase